MAPRKRPWFRFYVEAVWDRKLRRLSPAHRWLWVTALAVARDSSIPGVLWLSEQAGALTVHDWVDVSALSNKEVRSGLDELKSIGLLEFDSDLGALYVVNWNERQFESDDVSIRTAKHREKNDEPPPKGTSIERSKNGDSDVLGTPPENREQKTDTEADIAPLPPRSGGTGTLRNQDLNPRAKGTNPRTVAAQVKAERRAVVDNCATCEGRSFILDANDVAVDCPDCAPSRLRVVQ